MATTSTTAPTYTAYQIIVAWLLFGLLAWLLAKTKIGYTLIYYVLVLAILFLVLTQYQAITSLLAPLRSNPNG